MKRRVLVTRPQPGADATAARLRGMGFSPVLLPLTRIVPVEPGPLPDPNVFDAVAVTSVNALRHAPRDLVAALREKPVFAVGEASAAAARVAGFGKVHAAAGTARDLAALIGRECRPGARLLHLAGVERTAGFSEALEAAGFGITIAEVYDAQEISYATDFLETVAGRGWIWAALVLSPRAGALLSRLAARPEMNEALENTLFFCISHNAAAPLARIAAGRVFVSGTPSEDGVLLLLSSQG